MFGIGWPEFLLIVGVAIVVIGPDDIPKALYSLGKLFKKFKTLSNEVHRSIEVMMLESELGEITKEANKVGIDTISEETHKQLNVEGEKDDAID